MRFSQTLKTFSFFKTNWQIFTPYFRLAGKPNTFGAKRLKNHTHIPISAYIGSTTSPPLPPPLLPREALQPLTVISVGLREPPWYISLLIAAKNVNVTIACKSQSTLTDKEAEFHLRTLRCDSWRVVFTPVAYFWLNLLCSNYFRVNDGLDL